LSMILDMLEARRERVEARRDRILDAVLGPPPRKTEEERPVENREEEIIPKEIPAVPVVDEKLFLTKDEYVRLIA